MQTRNRIAAIGSAAVLVALAAASPAAAADDSTIFGEYNTIAVDAATRLSGDLVAIDVTYSCENKDDLSLSVLWDSTDDVAPGEYPSRGGGNVAHADLTCDNATHQARVLTTRLAFTPELDAVEELAISARVVNPEGAPYARRDVIRSV